MIFKTQIIKISKKFPLTSTETSQSIQKRKENFIQENPQKNSSIKALSCKKMHKTQTKIDLFQFLIISM